MYVQALDEAVVAASAEGEVKKRQAAVRRASRQSALAELEENKKPLGGKKMGEEED
eukprot:gene6818-30790_t